MKGQKWKKQLDTKCFVRNDKLMCQTCMAQPAEEQFGVLSYPTDSTSFWAAISKKIRTWPSLAAVSRSFSKPSRAILLCSSKAQSLRPQQQRRVVEPLEWVGMLRISALCRGSIKNVAPWGSWVCGEAWSSENLAASRYHRLPQTPFDLRKRRSPNSAGMR